MSYDAHRESAKFALERFRLCKHDISCNDCAECYLAALVEALRQARREMREQAARVCESHEDHGEFWHGGRDECVHEAAKDIRQLKE